VNGLYDLLFAEAWPVTVNPARFRSDEARMQVMARIAGILGDLEAAVRRELGRANPTDINRQAQAHVLIAATSLPEARRQCLRPAPGQVPASCRGVYHFKVHPGSPHATVR
jgi:hypothetical protein